MSRALQPPISAADRGAPSRRCGHSATIPEVAKLEPDDQWRVHRRQQRRRALICRRRVQMLALACAGLLASAIALWAADFLGGRSHSLSPAASVRSTVGQSKAAPRRRERSAPSAMALPRPPSSESVPILMYHVIAFPIPNAPYPGLYVPPAAFAAQMRALAAAGYRA